MLSPWRANQRTVMCGAPALSSVATIRLFAPSRNASTSSWLMRTLSRCLGTAFDLFSGLETSPGFPGGGRAGDFQSELPFDIKRRRQVEVRTTNDRAPDRTLRRACAVRQAG